MHLHIKLSSLLLIKVYFNKISDFLCLQSYGFCPWFSSGGQQAKHRKWRGRGGLTQSCFSAQYSMLESSVAPAQTYILASAPHHFRLLTPTQPRPSPRKRRVVTALHFLCPFIDPRQSLLSIFTAQSLSSTVCSQKPDHYLPYPFVFSAGRTLRVSHVATPTASGPQLLCPRPLSFNSMQKLGNCLLVLNTKSLKKRIQSASCPSLVQSCVAIG